MFGFTRDTALLAVVLAAVMAGCQSGETGKSGQEPAATGPEGLGILESHGVDVVLCDIKMPGMSGIDVLKRAKEARPDLEVIMITGHGGLDNAVEALREGAFDYTTKPIKYEEIRIAIARLASVVRDLI